MVYSPHVARLDLWKTSGHVDYYRENMFAPMEVEDSEYQLKPMNCPFHIMIYKSHLSSYRDLPIRYGELGTVYRYERTGVLHGLLRVRGFTQDDAHLFCRPDQIEARSQPGPRLYVLYSRDIRVHRIRSVPSRRSRKSPSGRKNAGPKPRARSKLR